MRQFEFLKGNGAEWLLSVHLAPRASFTKVAGVHGARLKIAVKAPPVEGRANEELIDFLSQELRIPKAALSIKSGLQGRAKTIALNIDAERLENWLLKILS